MRFATPQLRQLIIADEGQALVLTSLALVVLLLMAGLGVDVGYLRYQKQQMQKAADAGAIAGASALIYGGEWRLAAQADAAANGFADGVKGIRVIVNSPPTSGPNQTAGFVEVIVDQPQPTFFMRVGGFNSVPVRSRAVASSLGIGSGCVFSLAPTGDNALDVRGNVTITSACSIFINSNDPSALNKLGNSGVVKAPYIGIVANESQSNLFNVISEFTTHLQPATGIARLDDPLGGVPAPTPAPGCASPSGNLYRPGTYCGGITITGNGTYTFAPGLYTLLGGGLITNGTPTLTDNGRGVTFYNTFDATHPYGGIAIHGTAATSLSAPTTGPQAGILFFQDRRVPVGSAASTFAGSNGEAYTGALYFPTTALHFQSRRIQGLAAYTILVAWALQFKGDTVIDLLPGGSPIHSAMLVE